MGERWNRERQGRSGWGQFPGVSGTGCANQSVTPVHLACPAAVPSTPPPICTVHKDGSCAQRVVHPPFTLPRPHVGPGETTNAQSRKSPAARPPVPLEAAEQSCGPLTTHADMHTPRLPSGSLSSVALPLRAATGAFSFSSSFLFSFQSARRACPCGWREAVAGGGGKDVGVPPARPPPHGVAVELCEGGGVGGGAFPSAGCAAPPFSPRPCGRPICSAELSCTRGRVCRLRGGCAPSWPATAG